MSRYPLVTVTTLLLPKDCQWIQKLLLRQRSKTRQQRARYLINYTSTAFYTMAFFFIQLLFISLFSCFLSPCLERGAIKSLSERIGKSLIFQHVSVTGNGLKVVSARPQY